MPRLVPSQVVRAIDRILPDITNQSNYQYTRGMQANLEMILELIDQIPPELIRLDGDNYSDFVISIAGLRSIFSKWQSREAGTPVVQSANYGANINPIYLLRELLSICPDEAPHPSTVELPFIDDEAFRESIRIDISSANQALSNGEWKAATVLAGAVVEALLLWALQKHDNSTPDSIQTSVRTLRSSNVLTRNPGSDLERWVLHPFIEVAEQIGVIKPETAEQARLAKDYRNFIHPGKAKRLGQECNRGTALGAIAAVELVAYDLTRT